MGISSYTCRNDGGPALTRCLQSPDEAITRVLRQAGLGAASREQALPLSIAGCHDTPAAAPPRDRAHGSSPPPFPLGRSPPKGMYDYIASPHSRNIIVCTWRRGPFHTWYIAGMPRRCDKYVQTALPHKLVLATMASKAAVCPLLSPLRATA